MRIVSGAEKDTTEAFNILGGMAIQKIPRLRLGIIELRVASFHKNHVVSQWRIPEHQHPNFEFAIADKGEFTNYCEDSEIVCRGNNGTIFFAPPSVLHHRKIGFPGKKTQILSFVLLLSGVKQEGHRFCREVHAKIRKHGFAYQMTPAMRVLHREIKRQSLLPPAIASVFIGHLLAAFLIAFFQEYFPEIFAENAAVTSSEVELFTNPERIGFIKRLIVRQLNNRILEPEELEFQLNLSRNYLNRIFREATGMSMRHFWEEERIKNAKILLADSNVPVTDIAKTMGFELLGDFSKSFKKQTGKSPSLFREYCFQKSRKGKKRGVSSDSDV